MPLLTPAQARWIAPGAWGINVLAQLYGMLVASPNMKEVADSYEGQSAFTPLPIMIAIFFTPQQLVQVAWIARLWNRSPQSIAPEALDYAPFFSLGNVCIALWQVFWCQKAFVTSNMFVVINSVSQLYFMLLKLPQYGSREERDIVTDVNVKTFAGIGILDLLHNGAVAFFSNVAPNTFIKILTPLGFVAGSLVSDSIVSACLTFDALALCLGQRSHNKQWSIILGGTALASGVITIAKFFSEQQKLRDSSSSDHTSLPNDDAV